VVEDFTAAEVGSTGEADFTAAAREGSTEEADFTAAAVDFTVVITVGAMGGTEVTTAGTAAIGATLVTVMDGDSVLASAGVPIGRDILMRTDTVPGGPPLTIILMRILIMFRTAILILARTVGTATLPVPLLTATPRRILLSRVT
jgi:hypothetical protein